MIALDVKPVSRTARQGALNAHFMVWGGRVHPIVHRGSTRPDTTVSPTEELEDRAVGSFGILRE
jgi:hypothetical protein